MERAGASRDWGSYYARTAQLPHPEMTTAFLKQIPHAGRVLDFGAGSGRWSAAFLRDRADLIVDALDRNIDQALLLPEDWQGDKISASFQDFVPTRQYDGIWASSTLFFLDKVELRTCFHKLASALKGKGIISFTMVNDCHAAQVAKFHGLSELGIKNILKEEGLELTSLVLEKDVAYGVNKIVIPTFSVTARRIN